MGTWHCQRCGNCCRWPGVVRVSEAEIERIAAFIAVPVAQFLDQYTALRPDRSGLTLISRDDNSCIFLEGENHCTIQAVKPRQCANFLVTWFPTPEDNCEAIYTDD